MRPKKRKKGSMYGVRKRDGFQAIRRSMEAGSRLAIVVTLQRNWRALWVTFNYEEDSHSGHVFDVLYNVFDKVPASTSWGRPQLCEIAMQRLQKRYPQTYAHFCSLQGRTEVQHKLNRLINHGMLKRGVIENNARAPKLVSGEPVSRGYTNDKRRRSTYAA